MCLRTLNNMATKISASFSALHHPGRVFLDWNNEITFGKILPLLCNRLAWLISKYGGCFCTGVKQKPDFLSNFLNFLSFFTPPGFVLISSITTTHLNHLFYMHVSIKDTGGRTEKKARFSSWCEILPLLVLCLNASGMVRHTGTVWATQTTPASS